jgi:hypothetical protein
VVAVPGGVGKPLPGVGVGVGDADGIGLGEGVGVGVGVGFVVVLPTLKLTDCEKDAPLESQALISAVWLPVDAATEVFRLAAVVWYTSTLSR